MTAAAAAAAAGRPPGGAGSRLAPPRRRAERPSQWTARAPTIDRRPSVEGRAGEGQPRQADCGGGSISGSPGQEWTEATAELEALIRAEWINAYYQTFHQTAGRIYNWPAVSCT